MPPHIHGRGVASNPANRFERIELEPDPDAHDAAEGPATELFRDASRSVLARNQSPDVGFEVSLNPYRGCEHGCAYCYARPTHEWLGWSAGLDFETKILVKEDAPELLRKELASDSWTPQTIALSGVTDPYQPAERRLRLTRRCLEVLAEFRNPVAVVTKSELVTRDLDLLGLLARVEAAALFVSVTTLDARLAGALEPRASRPERRLAAIESAAAAGVPTGVFVAPVLPGLTEHELPAILAAAAAAGARFAGYVPLRLPLGVAQLFVAWLEQHRPEQKQKVLSRVTSMRGGRLNDPRFGTRMRGEGPFAESIASLFAVGCRRTGLSPHGPTLSSGSFRRPASGQLHLFPEG
jgi:DNA repair photolyase